MQIRILVQNQIREAHQTKLHFHIPGGFSTIARDESKPNKYLVTELKLVYG